VVPTEIPKTDRNKWLCFKVQAYSFFQAMPRLPARLLSLLVEEGFDEG
jgi:hypothetical protein